MPIYEYACTGCGHRFEIRQSYSDDPISDCTQCGARVRRVLHPAGVIFKGSGWYATDSRPAVKEESAAKADGASADAKSADSKTSAAAKPEAASAAAKA